MTRQRSPRPRGRCRTDFGMRILRAWMEEVNAQLRFEGANVLRLGRGRPRVHVSELQPQNTAVVFEGEDGEFKWGFM